jgi:hypothetical protein
MSRSLKILLSAVVALPVLLGGSGEIVLCLGANGHTALEFAHSGHCESSTQCHPQSERIPLVMQPPETADCVSCFDIPVSRSWSAQNESSHGHQKTRSVPGVCTVLPGMFPVSPRTAPEEFGSIPLLPDQRTDIFLRTTILLI